jgi:hypothetical protein
MDEDNTLSKIWNVFRSLHYDSWTPNANLNIALIKLRVYCIFKQVKLSPL